jgi:FKBP-type peptidyl-prolyl cis-trans isomerase SlyD
MEEIVEKDKYVELTYEVVDRKSGNVLTGVEFPLGYVHGTHRVLTRDVEDELEGKKVGDVIEVPIDCDQLFGPRDDSLVFIDAIDNVPEEYREVGTVVLMENEKGDTKKFYVTRVDEKSVTFDGNNPLSGREALFRLEILSIRDATDEEIEAGGKIEEAPNIDGMVKL